MTLPVLSEWPLLTSPNTMLGQQGKIRKDWNLCFWITKHTQTQRGSENSQSHTTQLYDHTSSNKHSTNV